MKITLYNHAIRHRFNEPTKAQESVVEREVVKEKIVSDLYESNCPYYLPLNIFHFIIVVQVCGPTQIKKKKTRVVVQP